MWLFFFGVESCRLIILYSTERSPATNDNVSRGVSLVADEVSAPHLLTLYPPQASSGPRQGLFQPQDVYGIQLA